MTLETKKKKMTIVLDIHGTLIEHTPHDKEEDAKDLRLRPYFQEFMNWLFEHVENVGLWTAGTKEFATSFVRRVQPLLEKQKFAFVWSQERCTRPRGFSIQRTKIDTAPRKPLRKLWKSKEWQCHLPVKTTATNTLIVDDTPDTYADNYGNGIPISSFTTQTIEMTRQLLALLLPFLNSNNEKIGLMIAEWAGFADLALFHLAVRLQRHSLWIRN